MARKLRQYHRPCLNGGWYWVWGRGDLWPIPHRLVDAFTGGWNRTVCWLIGHDDVLWHVHQAMRGWEPGPCCSYCGAPLAGCTGTGLEHGRRW